MMRNAPAPNRLLKRVLKDLEKEETPVFMKYLLLVRKELVHGTMLIQEEKSGCRAVSDLHRLVRLFSVVEIENGAEEWNAAFARASNSILDCIGQLSKKEEKSFESIGESMVFW